MPPLGAWVFAPSPAVGHGVNGTTYQLSVPMTLAGLAARLLNLARLKGSSLRGECYVRACSGAPEQAMVQSRQVILVGSCFPRFATGTGSGFILLGLGRLLS